MRRRLVLVAMVALCLAAFAVPSSAQVFTGRIDVVAQDATGAVLPGVTVSLGGPLSANAVTDAQGAAHFLNLAPGTYTVTAALSGFNSYKNTSVPVSAGGVVSLNVTLTVGAVAQSVEVTAETPVIQAKKESVSTDVTLNQLQKIPSSRDPWVILQTVPGIVVDRVNVGGAESGQQSNYLSKGASGGDNNWNMDGIPITDMAALGSSPTYYDFDMFQEMQVTTGGADVTDPTPGAQLNFVLKSGTNNLLGSGRYYFENSSMQANNVSGSLVAQVNSYNRMKQYFDTGIEVGGPIVKNRLFAWGAYGETQPELKIFSYNSGLGNYVQTARDKTTLKNTSAKITAEISSGTRASFTYFRGDKVKLGRGASGTHPAATTEDQGGPTSLYKAEFNQTVGDNLFLTARFAHVTGGFFLNPEGGLNTSPYLMDNGVWGDTAVGGPSPGTYYHYKTDRPQNTVEGEVNYFKGKHEFKAGFSWRKATVTSDFGWPGGELTIWNGYPDMIVEVVRDQVLAGHGLYMGAYASDTISLDRMTFNLGVRFDRGTSSIDAANVAANPLNAAIAAAGFPAPLPSISAPAVPNAIAGNIVTPRVGMTYALTKDRKTLLRASYAMFASQLNAVEASTVASAIPYYSYAYYEAVDKNGDGIAQPNEFTAFDGVCCFDPNNPTSNPNKIGNYKVPKTHEVIVGLDRELMANMGVSASFTWRRFTDFNWLQYAGVNGTSYVQAGTLSGTAPIIGSYSTPYYKVDPAAVPSDFSEVYAVRPGYHQRYLGLEVTLTKRLSNNWMMRMAFSGGTDREYFDNLAAHGDPTSMPSDPNINGGQIITQTSGSGKSDIYLMAPKYQFVWTGAYQAKWGINLGVNYLLRQGFAEPYYQSKITAAADTISPSSKTILLVNPANYRLPAVNSLDFRVGKAFNFSHADVNFDVDVFNLLNLNTTLGKQYDLHTGSNFGQILEVENPRILRLGIRVSFK
jgi:Carboxypeptidase regulatory-like domain/TonB-dependent Receptor Plug Domain